MKSNHSNNRREFLKTTGMAGLAAGLSLTALPSLAEQYNSKRHHGFTGVTGEEIPYQQQPLPYAYSALEPVIDAMTMEIHYSKHAATYAKNLADAVKAEGVDAGKEKLTSLLARISKYTPKMRNNAGGHYNHEFFWKSMKASTSDNGPEGELQKSILRDFGSVDAFKTQFADAGKNRFGSGWAWLVITNDKKLLVSSTPNQDNPLMDVTETKGTPLLGLDVWEHAYYLKYQNRRPDYINAWWDIVDWSVVQKRLLAV
ncbi:MAG TPA: Fe-Mn family superoxide dismutase [Chitinophagaceae bacterium]|jgi:Fe-Mn family superoxide dismutase|nr:Fe-Mn family superoxide dismutase [Chitinophagaceae bacterium]